MTVFVSAYDTKIGKAINIEREKHAIENAEVGSRVLTLNYVDYMHGTGNEEGNARGGLITNGSVSETLIRHINFPLILQNPLGNDRFDRLVVADARHFMALGRGDGNRSRIVNLMEAELTRVLMAATLSWANQGGQKLANVGAVAPQVYCRWIEKTLRRQFELSVLSAIKVRVLAAYFYQCQFYDAAELTERQCKSMSAQACRNAQADYNVYETMFDDINMITGVDHFVKILKEKVDDAVQLDGLDTAIFIERMMSTWFGYDGRQLAAAAIEHPPTFLTLLYMSFGQQGYKKAVLSQISDEYRGAKGGADFIRSMQLQLGLN